MTGAATALRPHARTDQEGVVARFDVGDVDPLAVDVPQVVVRTVHRQTCQSQTQPIFNHTSWTTGWVCDLSEKEVVLGHGPGM